MAETRRASRMLDSLTPEELGRAARRLRRSVAENSDAHAGARGPRSSKQRSIVTRCVVAVPRARVRAARREIRPGYVARSLASLRPIVATLHLRAVGPARQPTALVHWVDVEPSPA